MGYITIMQTYKQLLRKKQIFLPLLSIVTVFSVYIIFYHTLKADEVHNNEIPVTSPEYFEPASTQSFGFAVGGIIESANSVTIRALTSGIVLKKLAQEGNFVHKNQVLLTQKVPLLEERIALQNAQGKLSSLLQNASVIGKTGEMEGAEIGNIAASTNLTLSKTNTNTSIENATSLLATQLYGSITNLIVAVDFIETNKSYFPGTSLAKFHETIHNLYGNTSVLHDKMQYTFSSNVDILHYLDEYTTGTVHPNTEDVLILAELIDSELDAVKFILISGENDFFDNKKIDQNGTQYQSYLTHRGSVIETQGDLRSTLASTRSALTGGDIGVYGAETQNVLSTTNYITAQKIAENATKTALQSSAVTSSSINILTGEESLGMPTAPFDGRIDKVFIKEGEFVSLGTPLMTIVGDGAKELTVSVPYTMLPYVHEGAEFTVDGKVAGFITRLSQTAMQGNITVVIGLNKSDYISGAVLRGEIQCTLLEKDVFATPRSFVFFDNDGAYITTETGKEIRAVILHDTGETFILKLSELLSEKIKKAVGIEL